MNKRWVSLLNLLVMKDDVRGKEKLELFGQS